ncbi:GyrI-like domain-containing protein [Cohnella sp. GCM10027633]|uniref:AraC family transcriptional regulator n=1 Tax=unclassified Cohnella TaxID=2636738 RepID=UPI003632C040
MQSEYRHAVNRVIDYIEANLTNPLTLEEVSGVSAFSPYHFHRVFKAVIGENVHAYIRRIRIEKAIKLLLFHPDRGISDIAFDCGLRSSAHFCRAFREHTGWSASEHRERYRLGAVARQFKSRLTPERTAELASKLEKLPIEIRNMSPMHAAYARYWGTINEGKSNPAISDSYERLFSWLEAREALASGSFAVGLVHDDPYITPPGRHRYDACVTTEHPITPAGEVDVRTIPGGKYAVVKLAEKPDFIIDLLHMVCIEWLPRSPYIWDVSRPALEIYYRNPVHHPEGLWEIEYCIPVKIG